MKNLCVVSLIRQPKGSSDPCDERSGPVSEGGACGLDCCLFDAGIPFAEWPIAAVATVPDYNGPAARIDVNNPDNSPTSGNNVISMMTTDDRLRDMHDESHKSARVDVRRGAGPNLRRRSSTQTPTRYSTQDVPRVPNICQVELDASKQVPCQSVRSYCKWVACLSQLLSARSTVMRRRKIMESTP